MENFENTYQENYRMLFSLSLRIIGDEDDVRDIIQEVFIDYYEKISASILISNTKNWLARATINKSIDLLRKRKKKSDLSEIENHHGETEEEFLAKTQRKFIIKKALTKLNDKERKLAILYSEGFSYMEMAEILNINYASVGKKLARTLDKIRKTLKSNDYEMF